MSASGPGVFGARVRLGAAVAALAVASGAIGQVAVRPDAGPTLAPHVRALIDAEYHTDEQRRDLRLFHGVWLEDDLDTPARRASASLVTGKLHDSSLTDPASPLLDRAEAMLMRGECAEALELVEKDGSFRAVVLRAEALETLGRLEDAVRALEPVLAAMAGETLDPPELVEGVRGLVLRARILGQERAGGADFRVMMQLLARARTLDRFYWPAHLAEAELLYEKANPSEARAAALEVLSLNPRCARAWALLGRIANDSYAFENVQSAAGELDRLVGKGEPGSKSAGSPLADVLLARARLRQNDPDAAERELRPTLRRHPRLRTALALQAAIAAERYDFARTQELLDAFDVLSPGSHEAYLEVGRTLSENRQYAEASRYLAEAARRRPMLPDPVIELGLLELQSGRDIEALRALRRAAELDSFNDRAANSLALIKELLTYDTIESEHFIVRFKPGLDEILAPEMLPVLERIHLRVTGPSGIDHEPAVKTVIELMPDHRWFAVRITGMPGIHTIAAATGPVIAMERPQEGPGHSVGNYLWPRVIQHEYTHTVTLSRTRNRIPHWFTEAAAVYVEDAPRNYDRARLLATALENDALFSLDEINIKFVRPDTPTDRAQAYAQGHWMYEYIVERFGPRAPLELMDRYAQGQGQSSAFDEVLGLSTETFMRDFAGWARGQAVSWGMILPEGVPSIDELRRAELHEDADEDAPLPSPTPELIEKWLGEHPDHPGVLELAVNAAIKRADREQDPALVLLLQRYAAARPVDDMPHRRLAQTFLDGVGGTPDDAVVHLEYLDARAQRTSAYAVALARRYAARGDWARAGAKAERAVQIAPFDADMRELAAEVAVRTGDWAEAERHVRALTRIEPDREIHQRRLEAIRAKINRE
ncbi:MAG: tetratricopeptide repeat protein [Planctomycetes bacterium]|nr:tetratricopeptide repeat protein [Planctomycetota bacterium]